MRQHVNPLSKHFDEIERIPSLKEMFDNPKFIFPVEAYALLQYLFILIYFTYIRSRKKI